MAFVLLGLLVGARALAGQSPYASLDVDGFVVRTQADCFGGAAAVDGDDFWLKLRAQIEALRRVLPADKLERLRRIPIDVHRAEYRPWGAVHHPSREWLVKNGYPAEMANSVEICNWREFRVMTHFAPLAHT